MSVLSIILSLLMAAQCAIKPIMSERELSAWYDTYNRQYFGGHLTNTVVFEWVDMHERKRMGETECNEVEGAPLLCVIRLDPTYNSAFPVAKATLLHEACHVKTYGEDLNHGPKWKVCMDTLYMDGAFDGLI